MVVLLLLAFVWLGGCGGVLVVALRTGKSPGSLSRAPQIVDRALDPARFAKSLAVLGLLLAAGVALLWVALSMWLA